MLRCCGARWRSGAEVRSPVVVHRLGSTRPCSYITVEQAFNGQVKKLVDVEDATLAAVQCRIP